MLAPTFLPDCLPGIDRPRLLIDGQAVAGSATFDTINPATEEVLSSVPDCNLTQLDQAIAAAVQAFPKWRRDETKRRQALRNCAAVIRTHHEDLSRLITLDQGKPLTEARREVSYAAELFEEHAVQPIPTQVLADTDTVSTRLVLCPLGVAALITPWNFPVGTAVVKIAPALLVGNTVVVKPSPHASLAPLFLGQILRPLLPPGVLNVVTGDAVIGSALVSDPRVTKVSLTGSVATGRDVSRRAAADLKRITLELGGNDPAIVLPDADIATTALGIARSAFRNAGQVCSAVKRVYVPEELERALLKAISAICRQFVVGDGLHEATTIGPLVNSAQRRRVQTLEAECRSQGARISPYRGAYPTQGYYHPPTLVSGVPDTARIVTEEQFGPTLPILTYRDIDDAIERANDSTFGLSASIWSTDITRAEAISHELECGRVGINGHSRSLANAPFGGFKQSGIGRELGPWGTAGMGELKVINTFK